MKKNIDLVEVVRPAVDQEQKIPPTAGIMPPPPPRPTGIIAPSKG